MISGLKNLDCGLYLMTKKTTDITKIVKSNQILKNITNTMVLYREFKDVVRGLISIIEKEVKIKDINLYIKDNTDIILYSKETQYRGILLEENNIDLNLIKLFSFDRNYKNENLYYCSNIKEYIHPIYLKDKDFPTAVININLESLDNYEILELITDQIKTPLQVAIERELIFRQMDKERIKTYERSIRDPLTNLFTRIYMNDIISNYFHQNDRNETLRIGGIIVDIDHFKKINDTYGHMQGDIVLKKVAKVILDSARKSDIPIRFGGEEFVLFTLGMDVDIYKFAERLRIKISEINFEFPMEKYKITASFGCSYRHKEETIDKFIERIDKALYIAKETGRNRVILVE
jgi:diguanylate cyclase (GGDEF)-like protein